MNSINKNNKESTVDLIVEFIEVYKERQNVYDDLNYNIKKIQGDFYKDYKNFQ